MKNIIKNIIILSVIIFFNNCASTGYPPGGEADNQSPELASVYPIENSTSISNKQSVQLTFNELLDPGTITSSIKVEPETAVISKCFGNKIVITPVTNWIDGSFKIIISRNLSDYSLGRNKLSKPIEIIYSTKESLYTQLFKGSVVNGDSTKTYNVAILDDNLNLISTTQTDSYNSFSLHLLDNSNENIYFLALENVFSDNIVNDIRKSKYALSNQYINNNIQNIYLSDPLFNYSINTVKLVNNNFGFILLNNGDELPFILNNMFFSGLVSQTDDFYYFDYNYKDTLSIKVDLENTIEKYSAEMKTVFQNNVIDTLAPKISNHNNVDSDYRIYFNEPVLIDDKNIFYDSENNKNINFKYLSPLEMQLSDTSFKSLNIDCKSVKDLNDNYMCDSIIVIDKNIIIENKINLWGEINGSLSYNGTKNIIVEAINLDNGDSFKVFLSNEKFKFDRLTPGNYRIWAYEHINKNNKNYFSGTLDPLKLAAKFTVYKKNVAVRANWKNTINLEIK